MPRARVDKRRLSLTFTGEEGKIVKTAIGDETAQRVLGMCREAVESAPRIEPAEN